jgi:hypothetical protein
MHTSNPAHLTADALSAFDDQLVLLHS